MATKQVQVQIPEEINEELTNLRGFRDLVGERWGYWVGARVKRQEMNDASEKERKSVREIRKDISDNLEQTIRDADIEGYQANIKKLGEARKKVNEKTKPFREKITPLNRAVKFLDNVTIPDSLKELGKPITPRFTLSKYIEESLAAAKKK